MTAEALAETVKRVTQLVTNYHRDAPFRAPEIVPEFQARLLNDVWCVLLEGQQGPDDVVVSLTTYEARALRIASIFGGPPQTDADPGLDSARRKLRAAEGLPSARPDSQEPSA